MKTKNKTQKKPPTASEFAAQTRTLFGLGEQRKHPQHSPGRASVTP